MKGCGCAKWGGRTIGYSWQSAYWREHGRGQEGGMGESGVGGGGGGALIREGISPGWRAEAECCKGMGPEVNQTQLKTIQSSSTRTRKLSPSTCPSPGGQGVPNVCHALLVNEGFFPAGQVGLLEWSPPVVFFRDLRAPQAAPAPPGSPATPVGPTSAPRRPEKCLIQSKIEPLLSGFGLCSCGRAEGFLGPDAQDGRDGSVSLCS